MYDCSILMQITDWDNKEVDPTYTAECPHCGGELRENALRCDICGWQLNRMINYKRLKMVAGMSLLTMNRLAEILRISPLVMHNYAHGRRKTNEQILERLGEIFNVPCDWLTVKRQNND